MESVVVTGGRRLQVIGAWCEAERVRLLLVCRTGRLQPPTPGENGNRSRRRGGNGRNAELNVSACFFSLAFPLRFSSSLGISAIESEVGGVMSSFNGLNLFGSGPHRFYHGKRGQLLSFDLFNGGTGGGSTANGLIDFEIIVRGRLVATSESALTALRDAIITQVQNTPVVGVLVDTQGRTFTGMSLVSFTERGRRDRGRVFSVRYEVIFKKL